jgi:hypothetical protein
MDQPRRFWHVTFWTSDGREFRRYVKCPYLVPTADEHGGKQYRRPLTSADPDWPDTFIGMTTRLGVLEFEGVLASYRVSPVPDTRVGAVRERAVRWSEIESLLRAA